MSQMILTVISTVLSGVVIYYFKKVDKRREDHEKCKERERVENEVKMQALENGLQAILRDRIIQLYGYCEKKGYVQMYEDKNMELMYKAYHGLDGNGLVTHLYTKFQTLPIKSGDDDYD